MHIESTYATALPFGKILCQPRKCLPAKSSAPGCGASSQLDIGENQANSEGYWLVVRYGEALDKDRTSRTIRRLGLAHAGGSHISGR